jgi:hypothetical protein
LGGDIGRQRDNLDASKQKQTDRWVGSANLTWQINEKLNFAGNYSNFTSFTNNQLNQFANINDNPMETPQPLDSINYRQISQTASVNIMLLLSKSETLTQNITANYSLNDMVNRENNIVRKGGMSRFHNAGINHNIGFQRIKLNITATANFTSTYAANQTMHIWGPTVNVTKALLKDKMQLMLGGSYNHSNSSSAKTDMTNLRLGATYTPWKRHSFNATVIQLFRKSAQINQQNQNINELTAQTSYAFSF